MKTALGLVLGLILWGGPGYAGEWPQWCGRDDRNMVSDEKGLPAKFEEVTDQKTTGLANVRWVARLGSGTYGSPVVAGGKVYVGGAEGVFGGDKTIAVLWCFRESDGKLLWRMKSPFCTGILNRSFGVTCTPTVEKDRVYLEGHMGDVLCLSANGMAGGNRGLFLDEAQYFASDRKRMKYEIAPDGRRVLEWTSGTPAKLTPFDADILWRFDTLRETNAWPFNAVNAAPLIQGDRLWVGTCTTLSAFGTEGSAIWIREWKKTYQKSTYDSPSLIVLDKNTGKLLATEQEGIFERTFHGAHSSPMLARVNGRELVILGGGDGWCYAFETDFAPGGDGAPARLKLAWKFNGLDPANYNPGFWSKQLASAETVATPVFYRNRIYTSLGNDLHMSGRRAGPGRLMCIDATKTGDITRKGLVWSFDKIRSTSSTVAIADGFLYTADASGTVYCLDAETGQVYWTHEAQEVWASPLAADGKVFIPTTMHGLLVLAQGKERKVLAEAVGREEFVASPAAANGTLFMASKKHLYAIQAGASGGLVPSGE